MFIQVIPNRGSPPAILLRESYREGGKVKKRTLCNLTHWPPSLLEGFKALLKGGTVISAPASPEVFTIRRALPHGHVAAVLGTLRQIGLDRILGPDGNRRRDLVIPMVAAPHRAYRPARHAQGPRASPSLPPTSPPPGPSRPRPPPRASARSWAWARSTRTSSTARSTGSPGAPARPGAGAPGATPPPR